MSVRHDVLVVGSGVAGLWAAIEAVDGGLEDVAVLSKTHPLRSHSGVAQGGIAAPLGNAVRDGEALRPSREDDVIDDASQHVADTIRASVWLADQDAVEAMVAGAVETLIAYEHMGCTFSRLPDGRIAQRRFGGHAQPRAVYAADRTGLVLLGTLYEQALRRGVKFYEEHYAVDLDVDDGCCRGLWAIDLKRGDVVPMAARAVVLATGGFASAWSVHTNGVSNAGDGVALAHRAGAALADMEMVQFHPTGLAGHGVLLSEACRAEGGHIVNREGARFMADWAPEAMELAPRDVVSCAIQAELDAGRGPVHLDLRHVPEEVVHERLPTIRQLCLRLAGLDPIDSLIPLQPSAHYTMGGIAIDLDGRVPGIAGLYAAGECACASVHGANRLGANSLLEASVFGRRVGRTLARQLPPEHSHAPATSSQRVADKRARWAEGDTPPHRIREDLGRLLSAAAGLTRSGATLRSAIDDVQALRAARLVVRDTSRVFNTDLLAAFEVEHLAQLAEVVLRCALERCESRGAHRRSDHPDRDDESWLVHLHVLGAELTRREVRTDFSQHPPDARRY